MCLPISDKISTMSDGVAVLQRMAYFGTTFLFFFLCNIIACLMMQFGIRFNQEFQISSSDEGVLGKEYLCIQSET